MGVCKVPTVLLSYLILTIYGFVQSSSRQTSALTGSGAALVGSGSDAIRMRHIMQGPMIAASGLGAGLVPLRGYYGPPMPMLLQSQNMQPAVQATSASLAGRKKRQAAASGASSAGAPSAGAAAAGTANGRKKRQAAGAASGQAPASASSAAASSTGRRRRQAATDVANRLERKKRQIFSSASSTLAPLLSMSAGLESNSLSGSGSSGQVQVSGSLGGLSGALSASTSGSGTGLSSDGSSSSSGSASMSASGSLSGSSGSDQSAQAAASLSLGNSTAKPKGGLLTKVKEILKESKEAVKSSVGSLAKDDKKPSSSVEASGSINTGGGSGLNVSGSASSSSGSSSVSSSSSSGGSLSASGSIGAGSNSGSSSSGSLQASGQLSVGQRQEGGLIDKLSDAAKKGKETIKETASEIKEKAREVKEDLKQAVGLSSQQQQVADGGSMNAAGSIKVGGIQASANINMGNNSSRYATAGSYSGNQQAGDVSGPVEKVQKLVNKGSEIVRETVHKIEDKAAEVTDKVSKTFEDNIRKPMAQVSGSGQQLPEGQMSAEASYNLQLKGDARERHLMDVKRRQDNELGQKPGNLKEVISQAKSSGIIPHNEDRSVLAGNHADEKSVAVDVMDKMHEISKMPVETVLKPIDKVLGYEKDPLIRAYDNSHEILRRPLSLVSKPVETMLTGAFKTTDEAKRDHDRLLQASTEQERREAKMREERARKEDRSVAGEIADRTVELAEKPFEIVLKPVDHLLGLDREGKKNPVLKIVEDFYGLSKRPLDSIAKPFESILRKMADDGQGYQVSVRLQTQTGMVNDSDPKLVTRLADGALNIADRMMTKPLEVVMKPLNHALGYDEPGKRNPILDAAHSLKNATKLGVELFTRPIDRIIKEIADIGAIKDDAEREAMLERKREEASRLVKLLDKIHELAQSPWQIVLRPVDRALGLGGEGRKEPLLGAWDVIHQVVRTPIQVVSKPVEDALLGEQPRRPPNQQQQNGGAKAQISGQIGPIKAGASVNLGVSNSGTNNRANVHEGGHKTNKIVDSIKKVERIASRPLNVITSPIRRLILGEDDEKVGSQTEKNNRAVQAKSMGQSGNGRIRNNEGPDKIIKTIENMNNVVLKPLEVLTQPISDIL